MAALEGLDFAEICITSDIHVTDGKPPSNAFRLDDVKGVAVVHKPAQGRKCARSWRILPEVGSDPDYPDLSLRDAAAMREIDGNSCLIDHYSLKLTSCCKIDRFHQNRWDVTLDRVASRPILLYFPPMPLLGRIFI